LKLARRIRRTVLVAYGATVVAFCGLLVWPGRLGVISRVGLAPDLLVPYATSIGGTNMVPPDCPNPFELPPAMEILGPAARRSRPVIYLRGRDPEGVVLVCPAGGADGSRWPAIAYMQAYTERLAFVGYRYEREGGTRGPFDIATIPEVTADAFEFVTDRWPALPVVVWGFSLGCGPALWLAAEHPDRVRAVILDSPGDLKHEITGKRWLYAVPPLFLLTPTVFAAAVPDPLDQRAQGARIAGRMPVLIFGCERDPMVDAAWVDEIAGILGGRAQVRRMLGAGHPVAVSSGCDGPQLRQFLDDAMPRGAASRITPR
jgi:pimeloyl-ACP methyl ester carboxylesterase